MTPEKINYKVNLQVVIPKGWQPGNTDAFNKWIEKINKR